MTYTILGTSKIGQWNKITLVEDAIASMDVTIGDRVAFYRDESGNIIIRGAQYGSP